jgi:hypothetical protein
MSDRQGSPPTCARASSGTTQTAMAADRMQSLGFVIIGYPSVASDHVCVRPFADGSLALPLPVSYAGFSFPCSLWS